VTAKSVLSDLSGKSNRLDLLRWFETINDKGINKINVYFDGFNGFNI